MGVIKLLLSPRPRADDKIVLQQCIVVLVTGCRWMDVPLRYSSYKTAWRRLKR